MARGRMISKSLSTSEKYADLVERVPTLFEFCHSLYPLMLSHTDDFGRLQGDAFTIRMKCYPSSPRSLQEFRQALQAMHDAKLITWYPVDSKWFVELADFDKHQQGLHKRTRSQFPEPPGSSGKIPEIPSEEKGRELKGTEQKKNVSPEPKNGSMPTTSPTVLEFPTIGKGGSVWQLSEAQVAEWAGLYPGLPILAEAQKALAWVKADTGRRKTASGMARFLVGWFNREVNRGGRTTAPAAAQPRNGYQPSNEAPWVCPHVQRCGSMGNCSRLLDVDDYLEAEGGERRHQLRPGVRFERKNGGIPREVGQAS